MLVVVAGMVELFSLRAYLNGLILDLHRSCTLMIYAGIFLKSSRAGLKNDSDTTHVVQCESDGRGELHPC